MADEPKVLTDEEAAAQEAQRIKFVEQNYETLIFMRQHPAFCQNDINAETLLRQMLKMGFNTHEKWSAENLALAYKEVDPALWYDEEDSRPRRKEVEAPAPKTYPWGAEIVAGDEARIKAMGMQKVFGYMSSREHGVEFKRQIKKLKLSLNEN